MPHPVDFLLCPLRAEMPFLLPYLEFQKGAGRKLFASSPGVRELEAEVIGQSVGSFMRSGGV